MGARSHFQNLLTDNRFLRSVVNGLKLIYRDRNTAFYGLVIVLIGLLGIFGPYLAPYNIDTMHTGPDGQLLRTEAPSLAHPLGTNHVGQDILSRLLYGARPTVLAGAIGGTTIITIGLTIGLLSGYLGGRVDNILMRFTDLVYGVPLLPFALVLVALFGVGYFETILIVSLVLWRGSARVIRSQVLQIKERPFIMAVEATGASSFTIVLKHILPNIAPMAVLFFALGTGYTILIIAGLAFLGVTDPFTPSWGVMLRQSYVRGEASSAWWWSLSSGLMISITVLSLFMFGRGYESIAGSGDDEALAQSG